MVSLPTPAEIARDASWLVQAYNAHSQAVRLVRMNRDAYRAASFLDDRLLQADMEAQYVPWRAVAQAAQITERTDARWIFHIGHVGSTLIARLLGELPAVLAIREPRILRDIATLGEREELTAASTKLFSRTFAPDEAAVVKATSFVSEIAPEFVPEGERALFLYASPARYIASILAGDASRKELAAYAASRIARMSARVPSLAKPQPTEAHAAAAAWACEMTSLEAATEKMSDRQVLWMDFDRALGRLPEALRDLAHFFGFANRPEEIAGIASGPLTRQYSKALEYDYSPDLRRDVIAEAASAHTADIREALAMLEDAAQESPLLARALSRSNSEA